jgi:hypothetical protein
LPQIQHLLRKKKPSLPQQRLPRRQRLQKAKPKQHLPRKLKPLSNLQLEDNDDDYYDELPEFQVGYRRPELVNQTGEVHDDLSDEVKLRLVLARKKALERYHEKWG